MFYHFGQNNSFGKFVVDAEKGISKDVIIEAKSIKEANARALEIGLYFGGSGDCPCCGDRWYKTSKHNASRTPKVYEKKAIFIESRREATGFVHYKNGTIRPFRLNNDLSAQLLTLRVEKSRKKK